MTLDGEYRAGLADCDRTLVVTAHEAFGWLAKRYGLHQQGVAGIDPDAEPDPKRLGELADLARAKSVTTVFTEALVSPKVAQTLAREAGGLDTVVLSPLEGLTDRERARGDDYLAVMRRNLEKLRGALGVTDAARRAQCPPSASSSSAGGFLPRRRAEPGSRRRGRSGSRRPHRSRRSGGSSM
jgi:ABC-type Zn uptake system ZnuABC Zn-binding protein ZnuA